MGCLLLSKVDPQTRRAFEISTHEKVPGYQEIIAFLQSYGEALSQIPQPGSLLQKTKPVYKVSGTKNIPQRTFVAKAATQKTAYNNLTENSSPICPVCGQRHQTFKCPLFHRMSPIERFQLTRQKNLCENCLSVYHTSPDCNSNSSCKICQESHHSLLHLTPVEETDLSKDISGEAELATVGIEAPGTYNVFNKLNPPQLVPKKLTILPTAVVLVETPLGEKKARFLIDSGSQAHFITHQCCKRLNLNFSPKQVPIEGMGEVPLQAMGETTFTLRSQFETDARFKITALVTGIITRGLPSHTLHPKCLHYLRGLPLADEEFFRPGPVDGILGAQLFGKILQGKVIFGPGQSSQAVQTRLGFIVLGESPTAPSDKTSKAPSKIESRLSPQPLATFCIFNNESLSQAVQRFWELEEVPTKPKLTPEEIHCEELFVQSTTRVAGNHYCVQLPFKEFPPVLGNSRTSAENRFLSLERKFLKDPAFHDRYTEVIRDYLAQGHLSLVPETSDLPQISTYLPHFAVVRESSSTPLRIVFDAAARTSNGRSLNDVLFTGPKLQKDISQILIAFRSSAVALIADIRQMYRHIAVEKRHRRFQRILWRDSPKEPIRTYELNCVVFGLTSAPYLALRTVQQLTIDEGDKFPLAAKLANRYMYVDDLIVSLSSETEAVRAYRQLVGLFTPGGFKLTKWASSSPTVLSMIPHEDRLLKSVEFRASNQITDTMKILGLRWEYALDAFVFSVPAFAPLFTKRGILSIVARIWDPLGLLAPVTLYAKLIIKEAWETNLDWDDLLPSRLHAKWKQFTDELPALSTLRFPRHFGSGMKSAAILIGFADSSEKGYGAMVYIRVNDESPVISLLYAKSRVTPKKTVTLPKLELCAAVLLAQIMKVCQEALADKFKAINIYALTDSTVTLAWIKNGTIKRETFVANRLSVIDKIIPSDSWYHIRSSDNAADDISRGLSPSDFVKKTSWIHGPAWLRLEVHEWLMQNPAFTNLKEDPGEVIEPTKIYTTVTNGPPDHWLATYLQRFSSWKKLVRVTVWLLRFAKRLPLRNHMELQDLEEAERVVLRQVQRDHFSQAIQLMQHEKPCAKNLRILSPFMEKGLLRVGGRLSKSSLPLDSKHPILLPKNSRASLLIIEGIHKSNFHTGPTLVLTLLRQKYWILSARSLVRKCIRNCNYCFRFRPRPTYPPMADLPAPRVLETKPFLNTGVDYAGPYQISISRRRGAHTQKAYLCLFICLSTKAIHLELASSLTTEAFLACFKRFVSRRGPVSCMYSDRGTNFIGAKAEIEKIHSFLESEEFSKPFQRYVTDQCIRWKFNPPQAPHFGGIWEGNIRAVKTHLVKIIGLQILGYEELYTVLVQIEALLNSRPLSVLSSDPAEPEALTPPTFSRLALFAHCPYPASPRPLV